MPNVTTLLSILFSEDTTYKTSSHYLAELEQKVHLEMEKVERLTKANYPTFILRRLDTYYSKLRKENP